MSNNSWVPTDRERAIKLVEDAVTVRANPELVEPSDNQIVLSRNVRVFT
jgi:hypothetical protein